VGTPCEAPKAASAARSFGKQLPPNPQPDFRNESTGAPLIEVRGVQAALHLDDVESRHSRGDVGHLVGEER
jgi:hypothetical protein